MQTGKKPTEQATATDWERVKREAAQDAPIPFDPAGEPYDPNDAKAVIRASVRRMIVDGIAQSDGGFSACRSSDSGVTK